MLGYAHWEVASGEGTEEESEGDGAGTIAFPVKTNEEKARAFFGAIVRYDASIRGRHYRQSCHPANRRAAKANTTPPRRPSASRDLSCPSTQWRWPRASSMGSDEG
jgi:hypothetical protein